ncbi:fasciclin domain-containing protein [Ekhidna sp.]|uniref:fasciclin domain-containing protein n=1 Tax=Ekhidna sp. TaxID=2608089 RepID=UPI00329A45E3
MKKSILKYFKAFTLIGVMASFIALSSCSDDGDDVVIATETIWQILESRDNLSSLETELLAVDLDASLKADGELTLFAPTNAALSTLLGTLGLEDFSTVSTDIATAVLAYHVAGQVINSEDLVEGATFTTLQGETFEVGGGPSIISGATSNATFSVTDIQATNGVVHIIDVVMVPPTIGAAIVATLGTVAQPVLLGADFSILAEGIAKADEGKAAEATIVGALTQVQDLTVFAPTNATFEAAAGVTESDDEAAVEAKVQGFIDALSAAQWDAYVRNHVVVGQGGGTDDGIETLGPDDFDPNGTFNTLAGTETAPQRLFIVTTGEASATATAVNPNAPGIYIDSDQNFDPTNSAATLNAEIVIPDAVSSSNGRIHVIAGILVPATAQ